MEITIKMFALVNLKLFKITNHYSIVTEADRKYLPTREMGNFLNSCNFLFLLLLSSNFLHNPTQKKY